MRTPKYRVYIKHWGNSENDGIEYPKEGELHIYIGNWERGGYKKAIFQQFTGLKDSKGVDVYEGDIVKFTKPDYLESIETEQQRSYWEYLTNDLKQIGYGLEFGDFPKAGFVAISLDPADLETGVVLSCMSGRYIEVVGNIFEK